MHVPSRDGGTGRRSGLKIRRGQPRGGSTPPPGTNKIKNLSQLASPERRGQNRLMAVLVAVGSTVSFRELEESIGLSCQRDSRIGDRLRDTGRLAGSDRAMKRIHLDGTNRRNHWRQKRTTEPSRLIKRCPRLGWRSRYAHSCVVFPAAILRRFATIQVHFKFTP